jgi:hypothetical protein
MKKTTPFFCALTLATAIAVPALYAEDGICHRCEVIREQNKTSHHNYEYYEDYLKSEGKEGQVHTPAAPVTKNPKSNKKNSSNRQNSNKNANNNNNQNNNNQNNNNNSNNNTQNPH